MLKDFLSKQFASKRAKGLAVVLTAGATLAGGTVSAYAANTCDPTDGVSVQNAAESGSEVGMTSKFRAPKAGRYNLDTEVVDEDGQQVAQFAEDVDMSGGQRVSKRYKWSTAGVEEGDYTVKQTLTDKKTGHRVSRNHKAGKVRVGHHHKRRHNKNGQYGSTITTSAVDSSTTTIVGNDDNDNTPVETSIPETTPTSEVSPVTTIPVDERNDLRGNAVLKARAAMITSSFENSDLRLKYGYAENIGDGRGITAGRAGFTSGTNDLYQFVKSYTAKVPNNGLAKYLDALENIGSTGSTDGLDGFAAAFAAEDTGANKAVFRSTQDALVDKMYFTPSITLADNLGITSPLGQAIIWDTGIQHGFSHDSADLTAGTSIDWSEIKAGDSVENIAKETYDAMGGKVNGNETAYLNKFLDIRLEHLLNWSEEGEQDNTSSQSRVDALRSILKAGKLDLSPTFTWTAYGDTFTIDGNTSGGQYND